MSADGPATTTAASSSVSSGAPSAQDITAAFTAITAPGADYAMEERDCGSGRYRVFSDAPKNLHAMYAQSAADFPTHDLYVYEDERFSYAQAYAQAGQVANALLSAGIQPGDRVGIALRNYPEWIIAFMGITSCGAIAVALNAWWTAEELKYGIDDSALKILFADQERVERLRRVDVACQVVTVRHEMHGMQTWDQFLADAPTSMPACDVSAEDDALILYTSGSTAHPKGVLSSHRGILHALLGWECAATVAAGFAEPVEPEFLPSMLLAVPLFHVSGLNVQLLSSFRSGRKLVGMYRWDAEEALRLIEAERITSFNGVPTMAWEVIQSPNFGKYDTSSLTSMGGGGAAMAPEHARQIEDTLPNGTAGTGYGMTETNGLGTTIGGPALVLRPLSCGKGTPPVVSVKIIDEQGVEVVQGVSGEICLHGAMNFKGYWNKPDATASTLINGWVHTGDLGHLDEEGYVLLPTEKKTWSFAAARTSVAKKLRPFFMIIRKCSNAPSSAYRTFGWVKR